MFIDTKIRILAEIERLISANTEPCRKHQNSFRLVFYTSRPLCVSVKCLFFQLPEEDEIYTVNLTDPTNGAVLGNTTEIDIVIVKNDDSIYFKGM